MISRSTGNKVRLEGSGSKLTPIFGGLKLIKDIRLQQFLRIILNHIKKNPEKLAAWWWLATTLQNMKVNWDMFFLQCQVLHQTDLSENVVSPEIGHFNGEMMTTH